MKYKLPSSIFSHIIKNISYSKLSTKCSLAFWIQCVYSKVEKVSPEKNAHIKYGILYHKIIERFLKYGETNYKKLFKRYNLPLRQEDSLYINSQFRTLDKLINKFKYYPLIEISLSGKIGESRLIAIIDLLAKMNNGSYLILDHKYSSFSSPSKYVDQSILYLFASIQSGIIKPDNKVKLAINSIKSRFVYTLYEYNGNFEKVERFINDIYNEFLENIKIIKPNFEKCDFCPWKSVCKNILSNPEVYHKINEKYLEGLL